MKRSKLGDVFAINLPNGYKLFQRAYDIPRTGRFIRVFDGLFPDIPNSVAEIVAGPHSYIINFDTIKAYRCGLARFIGNYPVPTHYPFPDYMFDFLRNPDGQTLRVSVVKTNLTGLQVFNIRHWTELPIEYNVLTLLWPVYSVAKVLYMFDSNWSPRQLCDFSVPDLDEGFLSKQSVYLEMIEQFLK